MKLLKNYLLFFSALIMFTTSFLSSCQKNPITEPDNFKKKEIVTAFDKYSEIEIEKGILKFKNNTDFNKAVEFFSQMTEDEYLEWADKNNFTSLEVIYIKAINAEDYLTEHYETLSSNDMKNTKLKDFSDTTLKYLKLGYLKQEKLPDGSFNIVPATNYPELSRLLTVNNQVIIDNKLISFSKTNKATEVRRYYAGGDNGKYKIITNNVKKERALYQIYFRQRIPDYSYPNFTSYFYITIKHQKKVWGKWRDRKANISLSSGSIILKSTNSQNSSFFLTESFYGSRVHSSYFHRTIIDYGYGGSLNDFIHTPHVHHGYFGFSVQNVCSGNISLWQQYGLK